MQGSWLVQPNAPRHGPFPATICIYPSFVDINRNGIIESMHKNPAKISQKKLWKIFSTLKNSLFVKHFSAPEAQILASELQPWWVFVSCPPNPTGIHLRSQQSPEVELSWPLCRITTNATNVWNVVSPPETRKYRTCCTGGGKTSSPPGRTNGSPVDHYWWCSTHVIDLNNLWISRYLRQFDISLMLNFFTMLIWNFAWLGIILLPSYILFASSQMSKNTYPVHTIDVILVCATLLHVCHFCIHHIETVSKRLTLCLVQLPLASFAPVPQPQL